MIFDVIINLRGQCGWVPHWVTVQFHATHGCWKWVLLRIFDRCAAKTCIFSYATRSESGEPKMEFMPTPRFGPNGASGFTVNVNNWSIFFHLVVCFCKVIFSFPYLKGWEGNFAREGVVNLQLRIFPADNDILFVSTSHPKKGLFLKFKDVRDCNYSELGFHLWRFQLPSFG